MSKMLRKVRDITIKVKGEMLLLKKIKRGRKNAQVSSENLLMKATGACINLPLKTKK